MKKFLLTLVATCMIMFASATPTSTCVSNDYGSSAKVEQLNDSTIHYTNVDKIEITQNSDSNWIYIYDSRDTLIWVQKGSFVVELPEGNYTVVSQKPFTKAESKTEVIYTHLL